jgi:hypothetical protein
MTERITIKGNKLKLLTKSWENDEFVLIVILLIIHSTLDGGSTLVKLKKIAFIFDAVKKDLKISKISTALAAPWVVSTDIRKKLILAYTKDLIVMENPNAGFGVKLTDLGVKLIDEIVEKNIMPTTRLQILRLCKAVSDKQLKNQNLIW